jgi:hypothetical protein
VTIVSEPVQRAWTNRSRFGTRLSGHSIKFRVVRVGIRDPSEGAQLFQGLAVAVEGDFSLPRATRWKT